MCATGLKVRVPPESSNEILLSNFILPTLASQESRRHTLSKYLVLGYLPGDALSKYMQPTALRQHERLYHRDQLRAGRYAALADAEGFLIICFALEALGMRLYGRKADLGKYGPGIQALSIDSIVLSSLPDAQPGRFSKFAPLYELVRTARNDAMHTGAYARHATGAAIELCIGLEEALMYPSRRNPQIKTRQLVEDFMVKLPVAVELWQPVAYVRQLMLTHSFSFVPVFNGCWKLISDGALARYMQSSMDWQTLLSATIESASAGDLELVDAKVVSLNDEVRTLLEDKETGTVPRLWLVLDDAKRLCGVLSPFELM